MEKEHDISNFHIVERPGYFGKKRKEREEELTRNYGDAWEERWQIGHYVVPFLEAVKWYDGSYYKFLYWNPAIARYVATFCECYDSDISNIACGLEHDPKAIPRHIQDISVRRSLKSLGLSFHGPRLEWHQYDPATLLHIRSSDTNGYILSPMNVPFAFPERIMKQDGGPLPKWCKNEDSVEAFWQRNKVIVVPKAMSDKILISGSESIL